MGGELRNKSILQRRPTGTVQTALRRPPDGFSTHCDSLMNVEWDKGYGMALPNRPFGVTVCSTY